MSSIDEAARLLCDARRNGALLDALPEQCRPSTLDQANAIQLATAALLGDSFGGWKAGATPDGKPARGGLLRSRMFASGTSLPAALVPLQGVEAEIAFRFDRDMPPRIAAYKYNDVAEAVTALPAIEIVDSRFRGYPDAPFLDRTADFMSNGAFICGEPRPDWRSFDLATLDAELTVDGESVVRRTGGHPAKDPLLPAVALVNELRRTSGVSVGQIVTTGTYTGLQFTKPGQVVVATFHGFGSVQVRFNEAERAATVAPTIFGAHEFTYRAVENWARLPEGWQFGDVAGVGVDARDQVYIFHRGEHPLMVFDRDGNFLRAWGDGIFGHPHGVHVGPDDAIYLTDDGDHSVRKFTPDGKLLLTIGIPGVPAPFMSGEPFRRCTHTALSPAGEIYVSDGYGNARVHKYAPNGRRLKSWGEPGSGPGQFNLPHNIACDADGWVYVADRENHRIQVFDGEGRFEAQWHDLHRPSGMYMPPGKCPLCYVGEIGPYYEFNRGAPNLGPRLSILANDGKLLARITTVPAAGTGPGQFLSPHGLAVDSRGDIYVGEVSYTAWPNLFPDRPVPRTLRSLQKFERVVGS